MILSQGLPVLGRYFYIFNKTENHSDFNDYIMDLGLFSLFNWKFYMSFEIQIIHSNN